MVDKLNYKSIKKAIQFTWQLTCQELKNVFTDSGVIIIFFAGLIILLSTIGYQIDYCILYILTHVYISHSHRQTEPNSQFWLFCCLIFWRFKASCFNRDEDSIEELLSL